MENMQSSDLWVSHAQLEKRKIEVRRPAVSIAVVADKLRKLPELRRRLNVD
jgi:hypothetical protein